MNFKDLQLSPLLLKALDKKGYSQPSPIQEEAIPYVLQGQDLLGCAQTGTGKTAAFALPIIQNLMEYPKDRQKKKPIRALILTPTRELALQISENIKEYGAYTPIDEAVIFGGVSAVPQIKVLRKGIDILVATPGRLNDLIGQQEIDLSYVDIFVLDEADRMLDMGFIHDVKRVIARLPKKRQTLLFSATMPDEIQTLAAKLLHNPVKVEVTPISSTVDTIEASLYYVEKADKRPLLVDLLKHENFTSTLVFTRTKHGADRVSKYLTRAGICAAAIHGDKSQNARQSALGSFKSGQLRVLVATDIAARGIDIVELSCVINFDLPNIPETYVHRIGRTGRAGLGGRAISFCDVEEIPYVKDIEKLIGKTIPVIEDHAYPMTLAQVSDTGQSHSALKADSKKSRSSRKARSTGTARSSRENDSAGISRPVRKTGSPRTAGSLQDNDNAETSRPVHKTGNPRTAGSLQDNDNAGTSRPVHKTGGPRTAGSLQDNDNAGTSRPVHKTGGPKTAGSLQGNDNAGTSRPVGKTGSRRSAGSLQDNHNAGTSRPVHKTGGPRTAGSLQDNHNAGTSRSVRNAGRPRTANSLRDNDNTGTSRPVGKTGSHGAGFSRKTHSAGEIAFSPKAAGQMSASSGKTSAADKAVQPQRSASHNETTRKQSYKQQRPPEPQTRRNKPIIRTLHG